MHQSEGVTMSGTNEVTSYIGNTKETTHIVTPRFVGDATFATIKENVQNGIFSGWFDERGCRVSFRIGNPAAILFQAV